MMNSEIYKLLIIKDDYSLNWDIVKACDFTIGTPGNVEFNWQKVIEREEKFGDVIGFFHTHPNINCVGNPLQHVSYSWTDYDTMSTWVDCFGKPLYCLIGRSENDLYPTAHIFARPKDFVVCNGHVFISQKLDAEWIPNQEYHKGSFMFSQPCYLETNLLKLPNLTAISERIL